MVRLNEVRVIEDVLYCRVLMSIRMSAQLFLLVGHAHTYWTLQYTGFSNHTQVPTIYDLLARRPLHYGLQFRTINFHYSSPASS